MHTSLDDLLPLAMQWDALAGNDGRGATFRTFEWGSSWWECSAESTRDLRVITVWEGTELLGVAPFVMIRSYFGPLRVRKFEFLSMWKFAGSAASVLGSIDFVTGHRKVEVLDAVLSHLEADGGSWDILRLHPLPQDSPSLSILSAWAQQTGRRFVSRHVIDNAVVSRPDSGRPYRETLSPKMRARLRQAENRLKRCGAITYGEITSPDDVDTAYDEAIDVERRSWKWKRGIALNSTAYRGFYRRLARTMARRGWLRLGLLRLDGKPIAYAYATVHDDTAELLKMAYDDSYATYSPGSLLMLWMFERFFGSGVRRIDMLSGDWSYKRHWCSSQEPHSEVFVFNRHPYSRLLHTLHFPLRLYERGRLPSITFKRILRKLGIPWQRSELARSDQLKDDEYRRWQ